MEHSIKYISCPGDVDKEKLKTELDKIVRPENCPEHFIGLRHDIRWLDSVPVQDTETMAKQCIYESDIRDYDNLAVRYYADKADTAKLNELKEKAEQASKKYHEASSEYHFKNAKIKFITCKGCGSKINLTKLGEKSNPNICPVCGKDLRPESTLKHIKSLKAAWKNSEAKVQKEEKRLMKVNESSIMWLIKYEY